MPINWKAAGVHPATVLAALLTALYDRGNPAAWVEEIGRTVHDEAMWADVLGPLLDAIEDGQYHYAGPSPSTTSPSPYGHHDNDPADATS